MSTIVLILLMVIGVIIGLVLAMNSEHGPSMAIIYIPLSGLAVMFVYYVITSIIGYIFGPGFEWGIAIGTIVLLVMAVVLMKEKNPAP